jgi:hypothetical protein
LLANRNPNDFGCGVASAFFGFAQREEPAIMLRREFAIHTRKATIAGPLNRPERTVICGLPGIRRKLGQIRNP